MKPDESILACGDTKALNRALEILGPFKSGTQEEESCLNEELRAYAIQEIDNVAANYLGALKNIRLSPTISTAKRHYRRIERLARKLEESLGELNRWTIPPLFKVLDNDSGLIEDDPLYIAAHGDDFPKPWDSMAKGCEAWQSRLDALSRWMSRAAENFDDATPRGPVNIAGIEDGNPKVRMILNCEKLLLEFGKPVGLSREGPLRRFVVAIHRYAMGEEGTGWADAIDEVSDWRKSFSIPFWREMDLIEVEMETLANDLGFLSGNPPIELPAVNELVNRKSTLVHIFNPMTEGPHKLREYRKSHGGANPVFPDRDSPVVTED